MAHTLNAITNDLLPRNFLGLVAAKPMLSKISVQKEKISIEFNNLNSHFAESSGKTAARFVATGFSRSTVPGGFKYKIRIKSELLTSPGKAACAVIANEVPKFVFAPPSRLYAPHMTRATT